LVLSFKKELLACPCLRLRLAEQWRHKPMLSRARRGSRRPAAAGVAFLPAGMDTPENLL